LWLLLGAVVAGLSPRVRGSPDGARLAGHPDGSIPACAGEPVAPGIVNGFEEVYPRVCGGASMVIV